MWNDKGEIRQKSSSTVGASEWGKRGEEGDSSSSRVALTVEPCHPFTGSKLKLQPGKEETKR